MGPEPMGPGVEKWITFLVVLFRSFPGGSSRNVAERMVGKEAGRDVRFPQLSTYQYPVPFGPQKGNT
jgi:hypothetical protein